MSPFDKNSDVRWYLEWLAVIVIVTFAVVVVCGAAEAVKLFLVRLFG